MSFFALPLPDLSDEEWTEIQPRLLGMNMAQVWEYPQLRQHLLSKAKWKDAKGEEILNDQQRIFYESLKANPWDQLLKVEKRNVSF